MSNETTFNPYRHTPAASVPPYSPAAPAQSPALDTQSKCFAPFVPYLGAWNGQFTSEALQKETALLELRTQQYYQKKCIDLQADFAKYEKQTAEAARRQQDRTNHAIERDALGTVVKRIGSTIVYSKRRIDKSNLDIPLFRDCRSVLYQKAENHHLLILGISFHGGPYHYLASVDWNIKSFRKLLTAAEVSIDLHRTRSQNDALQKALVFLIQEAKQQNIEEVPSTYGWSGSGDHFRRISRGRKDRIWKELDEQCIR